MSGLCVYIILAPRPFLFDDLCAYLSAETEKNNIGQLSNLII